MRAPAGNHDERLNSPCFALGEAVRGHAFAKCQLPTPIHSICHLFALALAGVEPVT